MTDFRYLFPPRPTSAITPAQFGFFEARGFKTQFKMNGTCAVIGLGPGEQEELWNRHQERLAWSMPTAMATDLRRLLAAQDSPFWTVIVAELLHNKVKGGPRNTLYLHDLLVFAGASMVGTTYAQRHDLLRERFGLFPQVYGGFKDDREGWPDKCGIRRFSETIWLAENLSLSPGAAFKSINPGSIREGIVMKNPAAVLEPCVKESANSGWSVKTRYATKNYSH